MKVLLGLGAAAAIVILVFIPLSVWISGLRFADPPNPISLFDRVPMGVGKPVAVDRPSGAFMDCSATAIAGSALFLICPNKSSVVTLDAVRTMPPGTSLGDTAAKALASLVAGSLVNCLPGQNGWSCTTKRGNDLSADLIAAGFGVTDDPERLKDEYTAMQSGQGLWWDFSSTFGNSSEMTPPANAPALIRWRVEKDSMTPQFEVAQAGRAQAFASFFVGVMAFLVGGLLAYMLNEHRSQRKIRSQKDAVNSLLSETNRELNAQVNAVQARCSKSAGSLSALLREAKKLEDMYKRYEADWHEIRLSLLKGEGGEIEFVALFKPMTFLSHVNVLNDQLTDLLAMYNQKSTIPEKEWSNLCERVTQNIAAYNIEGGHAYA